MVNNKLRYDANRIAVCLVGQIRTGVEVAPIMKSFFGEMYPTLDFFVHTWDTESFSPWAGWRAGHPAELAQQLIPINFTKIEKIKEIYNPISMVVDNLSDYRHTHPNGVEHRDQIHHQISPQFISTYECNKLRKIHEIICGRSYNTVLRLRFDIIFTPGYQLIKELQYVAEDPARFFTVDRANRLHYAVEDIAWLAQPDIFDIAVNFALERELVGSDIDELVHFKNYLTDKKVNVSSFKNNDVYIYRDFDIENKLCPFQKPFCTTPTVLQ